MKQGGGLALLQFVLIVTIVIWTAYCGVDLILQAKEYTAGLPTYDWQATRADAVRAIGFKAYVAATLVTWSGPTTALALLTLLCQRAAKPTA